VHSILILAHNFGVQLLHLGDADLAERFVSKAMNLSRYAPNRAVEIRDSIQVRLSCLLTLFDLLTIIIYYTCMYAYTIFLIVHVHESIGGEAETTEASSGSRQLQYQIRA